MKEERPFNDLSKIIFQDFDQPPWPCFVKPLEDELLSSWLTRIARNHLLRYFSFCSSHFMESEFWNRDLDKVLPDSIRNSILGKSIIQDEQINRMLLSSYSGRVFLAISETRSFWLTSFNFYRNFRKHSGNMMICPKCLRNDASPYFRRKWRLTLSVVCADCGVELLDCCPNCGSEINYLQSEKGKKMQSPLFPITCCWKCLYDLRKAKAKKASTEVLEMQRKLYGIIEDGYVDSPLLSCYSHLYFDVLKKMVSIINNPSHKLDLFRKVLAKESQQKVIMPKDNRLNSFETQNVSSRRGLLLSSYWLLEDWPRRFRRITKTAQLRSKTLFSDFPDCPYWFYKEVNENNRLVFANWRRDYPEYSYSSFNELSSFRSSKIRRQTKSPKPSSF